MRWLILGLFALTWVGISLRRVRALPMGRPATSLVGAVAVLVVGVFAGDAGLPLDEALRAVEPHTIALLLGMLVLSAGLGEAGFFGHAVHRLESLGLGLPALLWVVTLGSGLASALLLNDAVCLLATPLVVALTRRLGAPVRPFLFAVAMGANAGSALTLSGNPQNMLVAQLSGLTWRGYLAQAAAPALAGLLVTAAVLHFVFRRELSRPRVAPVALAAPPHDARLLWVGLLALGGVVVANLLGAPLALSALAGAAAVLVAARERGQSLLMRVDWSVLVFFASLFILVAALQHTGFPAAWLSHKGARGGEGALVGVLLLGSQVVSNVPLILLLEPWIHGLSGAAPAWVMTALVSTLAGNLTLLGSVANVIVMEQAQATVGFFDYLKVGLPVTALSVAAALGALAGLGALGLG